MKAIDHVIQIYSISNANVEWPLGYITQYIVYKTINKYIIFSTYDSKQCANVYGLISFAIYLKPLTIVFFKSNSKIGSGSEKSNEIS